jgi:hypothetical protein
VQVPTFWNRQVFVNSSVALIVVPSGTVTSATNTTRLQFGSEVGVNVREAVGEVVGVNVGVIVGVRVRVDVGEAVDVGVLVRVDVGVRVGVNVAV